LAAIVAQNLHRVRQLIGNDLVRQVDKITRGFDEQTNSLVAGKLAPRSGEGDQRRLRGVPVVAEGVQGAMFGTRPDREIEKLDAA
jgi:hypothetical protein